MKALKILIGIVSVVISFSQLNASNVVLDGDWDYSINYDQCKVQIIGDKIVNDEKGGSSGSLIVQLRFINTNYTRDSIGGSVVAECKLKPLPGGDYYYNFDRILDFIPPKTGNYYVTISLMEYIGGRYCIVDYIDFDDQITYNKTVHLLSIIASGFENIENSSSENDNSDYDISKDNNTDNNTPNSNYNDNNGGNGLMPSGNNNTLKLKQIKCNFCNGTGISPIAQDVVAFGNTDEHYCDVCRRMVSATHGAHLTCPSCHGKGYTESYFNN